MSIRVRLLVSALATLSFVRPLLSHLDYQGGGGDILYFHFLWNAARTTWVTFHQVPLWNPYHCGGMVELANPHSMALSPLFIPALLFGADVGLHVFIIGHFVIAFWGMWEWARSRGVPDRWAIAAGVPFAMGGFFAARSAGHISFLAFAWTPWIMLCLELARRSWAYAYLAGVLVALCVYDGSPYGTTFMIVLVAATSGIDLAGSALARLRRRPTPGWHVPLVSAAIVATAFALVAALKLFPTAEVFHHYPRLTPADNDGLTVSQLAAVFLSRPIGGSGTGYAWAFDEYRDYVGGVVVAIAALTLVRGRARAKDLGLVVTFLAITAGYHGTLSPYALLHHVAPFDSQRVPSRFAILVVPYIGLWFAQALADIAGASDGTTRKRRALAGAILVIAALDVWSINSTILGNIVVRPPPPPPAAVPRMPFTQVYDTGTDARSSYLRAPMDHYGYVACGGLEPNPIPRSPMLRPGPVEQATIEPAGAGEAHLTYFSPNRLAVEVEVREPAMLVINQNVERGWRSSAGPTRTHRGRLAVAVAPGTRTVEFWYRPRGLWIYGALTGLGLLGVLAAGASVRRDTRVV